MSLREYLVTIHNKNKGYKGTDMPVCAEDADDAVKIARHNFCNNETFVLGDIKARDLSAIRSERKEGNE